MTGPASVPTPPGRADVVVVGAGAAGLASALVLGRAGLSVCVLEKQSPNTPVPRGEIIQPNGLATLARLGLLDAVRALPHAETRLYRFHRIGGGPLATFDYGELDTPLPTTLVLMPETIHRAQMAALTGLANVTLHEGAACKGLARRSDREWEVAVAQGGHARRIRTRMVIGADGALSRVRRAMGVGVRASRYGEGYLTGTVPRPPGFDRDGYYYLGRNEILGLFPVSADTLYFFYLVPLAKVAALRGRSPRWLRERMMQIHPGLAGHLDGIRSWRDLHYFPCLKVMAHRWHGPGVALVGHAAHSVNPHVAQGRNMALVDAEDLAGRVAGDLLRHGRVRPATLRAYEGARRPQAEALQRLGDELVLFWNAGNPLLCALRDRAFRGLAGNTTLRRKVTAEIAGLSREPLGPWERARLVAGW